jgi:hypothetical protein
MECAAFYERGFGAPSHWFLRSLLQFYSLELHHLTSLRILHMVAFVTLCEAYMGVEHHFNLWNYCFAPSYNRARVRKWWPWAM